MGLIRKLTSVSTLGVIDFRSDKERIARSTRKTSAEAKQQTTLMRQQLELQQQLKTQANATKPHSSTAAVPTPAALAPGWYQVDGQNRYWDGTKFADVTPAG